MKRLKGKVSIITGAASGIGKAIAELFSEEGAKIVIVDVDGQGKDVASQIEKRGGLSLFIGCDVSHATEVNSAIQEVIAKFGKIDVLVNNAGISGGLENGIDVSDEQWQKVIGVDLNGVHFCTKYVAREMVKNRSGSIINMSSMLGIIGSPNSTPYHAAKGGVRTYTKAMAIVLAPYGIRVNSIHPGYIDTELVRQVFEDLGGSSARKTAEELHPLGRLGTPREVAHAALFLACGESSFMTGSELVIDGGFTAQ